MYNFSSLLVQVLIYTWYVSYVHMWYMLIPQRSVEDLALRLSELWRQKLCFSPADKAASAPPSVVIGSDSTHGQRGTNGRQKSDGRPCHSAPKGDPSDLRRGKDLRRQWSSLNCCWSLVTSRCIPAAATTTRFARGAK